MTPNHTVPETLVQWINPARQPDWDKARAEWQAHAPQGLRDNARNVRLLIYAMRISAIVTLLSLFGHTWEGSRLFNPTTAALILMTAVAAALATRHAQNLEIRARAWFSGATTVTPPQTSATTAPWL